MLNKINPPKLNPDTYTTITLNHLVVYSIYYLYKDDIEITSEDIISACFTLFPKKFSLKKYPQWPDSGMISRHWSDCRRKRYIAAKVDSGFKLTVKGARLAKKVAKKLGMLTSKEVKPLRPKKILSSHGIEKSVVNRKRKLDIGQKVILPVSVEKAPSVNLKKMARMKAVKKVISEKPKIKLESKTEIEQKEKGATPVSISIVRPAKQKQAKPKKKVLPVLIVEESGGEVKPKEKAVLTSPTSKGRPSKQKRTMPEKKIFQALVIEAPKVKQILKEETVSPTPIAKVRPAKQKRAMQMKKVLPSPVIKAPKDKQGTKTKVQRKEKTIQSVSVAKVRPTKQRRIAPEQKVIPAFIAKTPKIKEKNALPSSVVKIKSNFSKEPSQQAKKLLPVPEIETQRINQKQKIANERMEKVTLHVPSEKVEPTRIKARIEPVKKASPAHEVETSKLKQEKGTLPTVTLIVTQEEKVRAGKFVRMMEMSDAYVHYKKNGTSSSINEFDFRSLLLCTMESSPETLARNVELFKGYAGIQNRQDLITFLAFCKDKFAYLFTPQKKAVRKIK